MSIDFKTIKGKIMDVLSPTWECISKSPLAMQGWFAVSTLTCLSVAPTITIIAIIAMVAYLYAESKLKG